MALKQFFGKTLVAEGLRPTLWWLFRGSPLYLRLLALILVVVSFCLGSIVWLNLSDTNNILVSALVSPWENAQHAHTGIASFLLSSIVEEQPGPDSPIVTSNFLDLVGTIETRLAKSTIPKAGLPPVTVEVIKSPSNGNNAGTQLFLSDKSNGFLFVPGIILTHPQILETKLDQGGSDEPTVSLTQDEEPRLFDDIAISQAVSSQVCGDLQRLNETSTVETTIFVRDHPPNFLTSHFSQAYLIFGSGVTRLCEGSDPGWDKQRKYYKEQFTASTLLEDRPYFAETLADGNIARVLETPSAPKNFSEVFHRTEPYIDLGGNGVVETFCRRMPIKVMLDEDKSSKKPTGSKALSEISRARYPYTSDAIFCLDFRLKNNIQNTLLTKIRRFGGFSGEFTCDESRGCVPDPQQSSVNNVPMKYRVLALFFPPLDFDGDDTQNLSNKFKSLAAKNEQSQMTGRISVGYSGTTAGPVIFTVPLGSSRILAGKLDLHRYQELSSWWGSLFAIFAAAAVIMLVVILADYGLKFREQERAFEAVDTVMRDVPTPYARLDTDGKFLKVNDALAKQLGFTSAQAAMPVLRNQAYQDFIIDDDVKVYTDIRAERKNGKPYRSYTIRMWAGGEPGKPPITRFEVHGWDIPTPRISKNKLGQSFGILLPAGTPKVVSIGEVQEAEKPSASSIPA